MRASKLKEAIKTSRLAVRAHSVLEGEGTVHVSTFTCIGLPCTRETLVFRRADEVLGPLYCEACDSLLVLRGDFEAEYELNVAAGVIRYRRVVEVCGSCGGRDEHVAGDCPGEAGKTERGPWVYAPVPLREVAPE